MGWLSRLRNRYRRWLNRWPNRTHIIKSYAKHGRKISQTSTGLASQVRPLKTNTNKKNVQRNKYNVTNGKYVREIGNNGANGDVSTGKELSLDNEEGTIQMTNGEILTNKAIILNKKQYLTNTLGTGYSIYLTKQLEEDKTDDLNTDTKQRTLDIYNGMTGTNHSLQNTIYDTTHNQTTDDTKVYYQSQQTDYFSTLNIILLIIYLLLVLSYAVLLYMWLPVTSNRIKVITVLLLIIFPYLSGIYYNLTQSDVYSIS